MFPLKNLYDKIEFTFLVVGNYLLEKYQAEKLKKHLEKIVHLEVNLKFLDMEEN